MSGGHWDYLSFKLEEQAETATACVQMMAAIEHELDWGICGDTSYEEAKVRVVEALEAFFDEFPSTEKAVKVLRGR